MQTLTELLELGQRLADEEAQQRAATKARKEAQVAEQREKALQAAQSQAQEYLGDALHDLADGEWVVDSYYTPPVVKRPLKFEMTFKSHGRTASLDKRKRNLSLPCSPADLARFIHESQVDLEQVKTAVRQRFEETVTDAINLILKGGTDDYFEGPRTPQDIYESARLGLHEHPDLASALDSALCVWRANEIILKAEEQAAKDNQADVQSKVWLDFTVWKLTYVAGADDGEIYTEESYSLTAEPDSNLWWPIIRKGKSPVNTRFPNLLKVEQCNVMSWNDALAKALCSQETIDGAKVLTRPLGSVFADEQSERPEFPDGEFPNGLRYQGGER